MITAAAIRIDGKCYTGRTHWDAGNTIPPELFTPDVVDAVMAGELQGFVTDAGTFLDRRQAYRHALECGQIRDTALDKRLRSQMVRL